MLFIFDENFPHQFVQGFSILERANRRSPFHVDVVSLSSLWVGQRMIR